MTVTDEVVRGIEVQTGGQEEMGDTDFFSSALLFFGLRVLRSSSFQTADTLSIQCRKFSRTPVHSIDASSGQQFLPIVLAGLSGSGKTTVSRHLQQIMSRDPDPALRIALYDGRVTTRDPRPDETEGVDGSFGLTPASFEARKDTFFYSYQKYGAQYGFLRRKFEACLKQGNVMVIGGEPDTSLAICNAINRSQEQGWATGSVLQARTVFLHRPLKALVESIDHRPADDREKATRKEHLLKRYDAIMEQGRKCDYSIANHEHHPEDAVHKIANIIRAERSLQLSLLSRSPSHANRISSFNGKRIHQPEQRRFVARIERTPLHAQIEAAIRELTEQLQERGVPHYLMGGIAACILSGEEWPEDRPLSRDIDVLIPDTDGARSTVEELYGRRFFRNTSKPVFHSLKLESHASNGVRIDCIANSRIERPSCQLSVSLTPLIEHHAVRGSFLGAEIPVLPPTLIFLQKTLAERGRDLGKFDVDDAQALLRANCVDPAQLVKFAQDHALGVNGEHIHWLQDAIQRQFGSHGNAQHILWSMNACVA